MNHKVERKVQALYRKYRSKSLSEVVGQQHVTDTLARALKNGRISHAYLFTGPRGVGKTSVARILAHELNKLPYSEQPHLDIIEIDAASNRRIDDIRDLRDKVHIAPVSATYKVYIIDEVHMLTGESFNALLKTLEEPPAHVIFILATTESHKLPATIISRTQRYGFRAADPAVLVPHLKKIAQAENIQISDEALQLIAEHGDGSFRDSISLLDQLANVSKGKVTQADVEQNLGLAPKAMLSELVKAVVARDHEAIISHLTELEQQGTTSTALVPQLLRALQQAASKHAELYALIDQLLEVPRAYNPTLKLLTTLAGFGLQATPSTGKPAAPLKIMAKPVLEVRAQTLPPKPVQTPPKTAPQKDPPPETTQRATSQLKELTDEQWAQILGKIKSLSPPLHGVLRHARPVFDAKKQQVTLTCAYQLHRKKLDDSKAKAEIAKAFTAVVGGAPLITTKIDAQTIPPEVPAAPKKVVDETSKSVMEVMGGGEVV